MTTKADVKTFINKVEYKAGKSVDDKYQENVKLGIEKILESDQVLRINIASAQKQIKELLKTCNSIKTAVSSLGNVSGATWDIGLHTLLNDLGKSNYNNMVHEAFKNVEPSTLTSLRKEYLEEKKSVKDAYRTLTYNVDHMTPAKAVKYLASTGFDITWFGEDKEVITKSIDTTKLFVCGEKS